MSEKIGTTLTKLLSCLFRGFGPRHSTSLYVGCPIDPASLPFDLADPARFDRRLSIEL